MTVWAEIQASVACPMDMLTHMHVWGGSAMGPGTQMDRLRPGDAHEPLKHQSLSLSFFKTFLYMLGSVRQVTVSVALCARALTGQPHTVFLQGGDVPTPPCPVILRPSVSPLGDPRGQCNFCVPMVTPLSACKLPRTATASVCYEQKQRQRGSLLLAGINQSSLLVDVSTKRLASRGLTKRHTV